MPSHSLEAERRQLTVMFCDLVDSTRLAGRLDPEDLRDVVRAYQERAVGVIDHYEGHVAQYLGDGLLVYFGWPLAHEDDAQRAVHTGLGIIEAVDDLNRTLERSYGVKLAVRLGIHTGLVVVGEMGGGGRHENLALGETPNIAARLEGLAAPNTVVISESTHRLVAGVFDYDDLGTPVLKGVNESLSIFCIRGLSVAASRFEATTTTMTPMVGREVEEDLLMRCWRQALDGEGQVVLLNGPPGIGKSRLIQALVARLTDEPHLRLPYQCSPYHTNSALHPIASQITHELQLPANASSAAKLDRLEALVAQAGLPLEETAALFAALLSIPTDDRYPPLSLSPQAQREQTLELFAQGVITLSNQQPILFLFEDIHWADPTTLEALSLVIDRVQHTRALVVLTYRPEFEPTWQHHRHVTTYTLNHLSRRQTLGLVENLIVGKALPTEVLEQIVDKTDGIPLFVEELTKHVLESEWLQDTGESYQLTRPLPPLAIPATLQDSLMARLDQLPTAKEVAQLGAVLGREFPYEMLQALYSQDDETLQSGLAKLVEAELFYQRGRPPRSTYLFKHALIQDVAYTSLLRSSRQQYHAQVVAFLESQHDESIDRAPDILARHCLEAGLYEQSAHYWDRAGQDLTSRCANQEAVTCFEQALQALSRLPESQSRFEHEFDLLLALRGVLFPFREFPRVFTSLKQAERLAERLEDQKRLERVLGYQGLLLWATRQYEQALDVSQRTLSLAMQNQDVGVIVITKDVLSRVHFALGDYPRALTLCVENIEALVGDLEHQSFGMAGLPSVHARRRYAEICAETGAFVEGKRRAREAIQIAEATAHPHTLLAAYYCAGVLDLSQGNLHDAAVALERAMTICLTEDIRVFYTETASALGTVYTLLGRLSEALELHEKSVEQHVFTIAHRLIALSETYLQLGRLEKARNQAEQGVRLAKDGHEPGFLAGGLRFLVCLQALILGLTLQREPHFTR